MGELNTKQDLQIRKMCKKQAKRNCQKRTAERQELLAEVAAIEARIDEVVAAIEVAKAKMAEIEIRFNASLAKLAKANAGLAAAEANVAEVVNKKD